MTSPLVRRGLTSNGTARRIPGPAQPRVAKFGNQRAVGIYGELYDSKAERLHSFTLEQKRKAGLIERWSWAPRFVLQDSPLITYRPDYICWPVAGPMYVIDVKGYASRDFSIRVRMWKHRYPDVPLVLVKNGQEVPA